MVKILVLNLGSTSFKIKLYEFGTELKEICSGEISNITSIQSQMSIVVDNKLVINKQVVCKTHFRAFTMFINSLKKLDIIENLGDIKAICYKAVHGGSITGTQIVNDELINTMKEYIPLAPKHNPIYIQLISKIKEVYPSMMQLVHFETSFHQTIPNYRTLYGIPYSSYQKYGVRRYGFHGSSHEYIAFRMKQLSPQSKRIISIHLGGSCSICAIKNGKSIASSMGATPQSGLFQNNRVGDLDVFSLPILKKQFGTYNEVFKALSNESGLKGLSGVSNDMKEVIKASNNNDQAKLAVEAFIDNIVGYVGMFTAYLGGLDAIVFTGGIGFNSSYIRSSVCKNLSFIGVKIDRTKNNSKKGNDILISSNNSEIKIYAIKTNEEYILAKDTIKFLKL